jgi:hypothetical protein
MCYFRFEPINVAILLPFYQLLTYFNRLKITKKKNINKYENKFNNMYKKGGEFKD